MSVSEVIELLDAEKAIKAQYHKLGGASIYGAFGLPIGDLVKESSGGYSQQYQFGKILSNPIVGVPTTFHFYACDIFVAAIKCFGSEDEGGLFSGGDGEDEPYVIMTNISTASVFLDGFEGNISQTWRSPTFGGITKGEVFGKHLQVFRDIRIGPYGILLKVALLDHEHGDEESLRKEVEEKAKKVAQDVKDIASALAGVNIDEILPEQVLDNEILDTLGDISLNVFSRALSDDKIDEKTWLIDGNMLKEWVDQVLTATSGLNNPELPPDVATNFPRDNDASHLFSGGGGSYKIYLRIVPKKVTVEYGSPPNH